MTGQGKQHFRQTSTSIAGLKAGASKISLVFFPVSSAGLLQGITVLNRLLNKEFFEMTCKISFYILKPRAGFKTEQQSHH